MPSTGDSSYTCTGSGSIGRVLEAVAGHAAAAAHDPATVTWVHAVSFLCYQCCSSVVYTSDRPAYHHFSDSSYTTQWASESVTTSYSVCFTYRAGGLVVCLTSDSSGSSLHSYCYGLHSTLELLNASDRHHSFQESQCDIH